MIYQNPFEADADRAQIWEMLVERDIHAYVASDWSQVAGDFLPDEFVAVNGRGRSNPDSWRLGFPALNDYRDSWVGNGQRLREEVPDLEAGLYDATTLRDIEIEGGRAIAHKKFDGQLRRHDGSLVQLRAQTLYLCKQVEERWRIQGFVGYLPNPMGPREDSR